MARINNKVKSTNDIELKDRLVAINRTTKVTKGGRTFTFAAMVVVGNEDGIVGWGLGKAGEVTTAIAKGVEAAKMIQDLYTFDKPQGSINRSANNAFGRGLIAYKLGSSSDIDALDTNYPNLNYGISMIPPKVKGEKSYSNMGGENLVIFNHSPKKANCLKLIEFLLREENINKIASFTGNFPAIEEYANIESIPVIKEESRARKAVILEQLKNSVPRPVVPKWIEVNDQYLGIAISDKVLSEDPARRDIQSALDEAATAANRRLFGS